MAEDALSDEQIAELMNMSRQGLAKWKTHPDFQARVSEIRVQIRAAVVARGIAERQNRVDALNDRWQRMRQVIEARAESGGTAPGAKTGLLVKTVKAIGTGKDQYEVEEWTVDTALLRELREHEKQAAQELGQWADRLTVFDVDVTQLSDDELQAIVEGKPFSPNTSRRRAGAATT